MPYILIIVLGYLMGSFPSGLVVGKRMSGVDIRDHGSGNLGGTNAFRVLGVKGGILVTLSDIVKGFIPALIGYLWLGDSGAILAGLSAIFGHAYPLFAGLRGGKSVATGTGVFLVLMPAAIGIAALVFAVTILVTQYVSLASLLGAFTLLLCSILFAQGMVKIGIAALVVVFVVYRHRANIDRLLHGREAKARLWRR